MNVINQPECRTVAISHPVLLLSFTFYTLIILQEVEIFE